MKSFLWYISRVTIILTTNLFACIDLKKSCGKMDMRDIIKHYLHGKIVLKKQMVILNLQSKYLNIYVLSLILMQYHSILKVFYMLCLIIYF